MSIFWGVMIPFVGTVLGAACVFLLKNEPSADTEGFAGVCLRSHGGGICVVSFDSGHGNV